MSEKHNSAEDRQALIQEKLLAATRLAELNRISHRPDRVSARLSTAQKRIWLLNEFESASSAWNRPLAVRLLGSLDIEALQATLKEIVRRHQILRTIYKMDGEMPRQVVLPISEFLLEVEDISDLSSTEREFRAQRIAQREAQKIFDLSRGPMIRTKLLRLEEREHLLLISMHHVSFDGWSENVFLDELRQIYGAFHEGKESPLSEPSLQYADFSEWEDGAGKRSEFDGFLDYWQGQFSTLPPNLEFPKQVGVHSDSHYEGGCEVLVLPPQLRERLTQFGQAEKASLFMILLMGFQLLLARYCEQDDISVGVPVAGRHRREIEELIGCFMNVLVLRTKLSEDLTVRQLLAQVRETSLGAFAHQGFPFDRLVEVLRPERRPGRWPLFQVMFQLRNLPRSELESSTDLHIEAFEIESHTIGGLDLSLEIQDKSEGLVCSLSYRLGLFEADTIRQMLVHFQNLLEALVSDPEKSVWALPMLTEAERHQQLVEWNETAADYSSLCVHLLVEQQVKKTPEAVAIISATEELTYRQLNSRANRLARYLRNLGVEPDSLVGICLERSPEMVVAILAVLKAGGAYVPLDPGHPPARLKQMLGDAGLNILLGNWSTPEILKGLVKHSVDLNRDCPKNFSDEEKNLELVGSPADLMYVIYTSGSTGMPKGVMVRHACVTNLLFWRREQFPLFLSDRVLHRASYTFDDSVWEIFEPLMVGAKLVLAEAGRESDSTYLVNTIKKHGISVLCLVPSQLEYFLQEPGVEGCRSLRRVSTGGEALPLSVLERFQALFNLPLYNGYGPTEATVACTFCECVPGRKLSIGRPIANTQVYILDRHLQPVPVGVSGELCVAGAGLASGYLNDPGLTQERFVSNHFATVVGSRLYRTGDRARYLPDSSLEFLGRLDGQVKIRGHRIEIGEVEAALMAHPEISLAAVVLRERSPVDRELVAYLEQRPQDALTRSRLEVGLLRDFLGKRIPQPMVPSRWIFLESVPLTTSGKIDRRALPELGHERSEAIGIFCPPRTPSEVALAAIWVKLLGLERVGIRDNFFDLGGHSLLAVSMFLAVQREFGVKLPLSSLYEAPTVEEMAKRLLTRGTKATWSPLVPIQTQGTKSPIFAIHAANGQVLMYGGLARHLGPDQPVYGLQSAGLDGESVPIDRVEEMADHYLREMRRVQPEGPYHLIGFCLGALIAWEIAHRIESHGGQVGLVAVVSHDARVLPAGDWRQGVMGHLEALGQLKPSQWMTYLVRRYEYRKRRVIGAVGERLHSLLVRMSLPIPTRIQHLHVAELNHRAAMNYKLQPGPWVVHHFEGCDDITKGGADFWAALAEGGVQRHSVAGRGPLIWQEPHVQTLAVELLSSSAWGITTGTVADE